MIIRLSRPISLTTGESIFAKSMLAYQKWGNSITPEKAGCKGDKLVGDFYVLYHEKEKEHPNLEEEAKQMLRDWENSDPDVNLPLENA